MDYAGNPNKDKEEKPDKQIEKVVTGEVVLKPKGIGYKFKNIFLGGDLRDSARYVMADVVLPATRDLIFDAVSNGVKRMIYGESMFRRRPMEMRSRVQYNQPVNRGYTPRDPRDIGGRLPDQPTRYRSEKRESNDIVLSTREEADLVVERLLDIIDKYEVASLADLYDLLGQQSSHVDNKWGWTHLGRVEVRQIRDGYLIDLPPLEAV